MAYSKTKWSKKELEEVHIPNGFLDPKVSTGTAFAAAAVLGYCLAKVRQALSMAVPEAVLAGVGSKLVSITNGSKKLISSFAENHLMKMAAIASLIFSAQMFNFPVDNGTSGHLLGGMVAAITLGPFSGTIVISVVLAVQSIFFGDGGIMALGANILNMAVIGTFASYYIYHILNKKLAFNISVALASFASVLFAASACAFEIALSGTAELSRILPAMAFVHARIGIAEALLTILTLKFLESQKFILHGRSGDE